MNNNNNNNNILIKIILIIILFINLINCQELRLVVDINANNEYDYECGTPADPDCNSMQDAYNYYTLTPYKSLLLVLKPGVYKKKLNSLSLTEDKVYIEMESKNVTIDGNNDDGSSNSLPFFELNNSELYFSSITFNNFTTNQYLTMSYGGSRLEFYLCTFIDVDTTYATIFASNTYVNLYQPFLKQTLNNGYQNQSKNTNFIDISENSNLEINYFYAQSIVGLKSLISARESTITINDMKLLNSTCTDGMLSIAESSIAITSSLFESNYLIAQQQEDERSIILNLYSTQFDIERCNFENNTVLLLKENDNSTFYPISGAIQVQSTTSALSQGSIKNSNFVYNTAFRGGAIAAFKSQINIESSVFEHNTLYETKKSIGNVFYTEQSNITVSGGSSFANNGINNGTFYANILSNITFDGCFFDSPISTYCSVISSYNFTFVHGLNSSYICQNCNKITIDDNKNDKCSSSSDGSSTTSTTSNSDQTDSSDKPSSANTILINLLTINSLLILINFII